MNKKLLFLISLIFGNFILNARNIVIYNQSNLATVEGIEFAPGDVITVNSFSGPGSTITIDNNEWRYTLMLIIKQ